MAGSVSTGVAWAALVVGIVGVGLALNNRRDASAVDEIDDDNMSDLASPEALEGRLHDVETRMETMERRMGELGLQVRQSDARAAEALRMASVAHEASADGSGTGAAPGTPPGTVDEPGADPAAELRGLLSDLTNGAVSREDLHEVMTRARELGGLDQAVAAVAKWAGGRKTDPDAQVMLGWAYTEKLLAVPDGPERGEWAARALASYGDALKLDPSHWDAQFQKSMNLSQWPAWTGKQKEAIDGFEALVKQQEGGPSEERFAETYFQLGNTYRAAGNMDKAKEAFQRGLDRFPTSKRLKDQLDLLKD